MKSIVLAFALGCGPLLAVGCSDDPVNADASVNTDATVGNRDAAAGNRDATPGQMDASVNPDAAVMNPDAADMNPDATGMNADAGPGRAKCSDFVKDLILNNTTGTGAPVPLPNPADCDEAEDQAEYAPLF